MVMATPSLSGSVTPAMVIGTIRWFGGQIRSGTARAAVHTGVLLATVTVTSEGSLVNWLSLTLRRKVRAVGLPKLGVVK